MTTDTPRSEAGPRLDAVADDQSLQHLHDVTMEVSVEFGSMEVAVKQILKWAQGSVLVLDQEEGSPLLIRVNGRAVGSGEAVVVNDRYGVRVTAIRDSELE